jgi:hypothetical protein
MDGFEGLAMALGEGTCKMDTFIRDVDEVCLLMKGRLVNSSDFIDTSLVWEDEAVRYMSLGLPNPADSCMRTAPPLVVLEVVSE